MAKQQTAKRRVKAGGSELGGFIRQLVEDRGIPTNHVSQYTSTDRSTIYQIYSGTRLPTIAFLKALVVMLRLPTEDSTRLFRLYHEIRDGKWAAARNDAICHLISCIWDAQIELPFSGEFTLRPGRRDARDGVHALTGESMVRSAALHMLRREALESERPRICLFVTGENVTRMKDLLLMCAEDLKQSARGRICVEQIIVIDPSTRDDTELDIRSYMAPLFAVASLYSQSCFDYKPFLIYSAEEPAFLTQLLYTNCVLAGDTCLYLTADGTNGLYIQNAPAAEQLRTMFEHTKAQAIDMLVPSASIMQAVQGYVSQQVEYVGAQVRLSTSPPLFYAYTREIVEKYVPRSMPQRDVFVSLICSYYVDRTTFDQRDMLFFTVDGIERFADTGILDDLPPDIFGCIDEEDRYSMLKRCYDMMISGRLRLYLLNESFPKLTPFFTLYSDSVRLWITDQRFEGRFDTLSITDHIAVQIFRDFCTALPGSEFVCSDEEAREKWQRVMNRLRQV